MVKVIAVYQGKGRVRKWNPGMRTQAVGTQGDHEQKRVEVHWWRMGGSAILRGQQPVCCSGFNQKWKSVQFREVWCLSGVCSWLNSVLPWNSLDENGEEEPSDNVS